MFIYKPVDEWVKIIKALYLYNNVQGEKIYVRCFFVVFFNPFFPMTINIKASGVNMVIYKPVDEWVKNYQSIIFIEYCAEWKKCI